MQFDITMKIHGANLIKEFHRTLFDLSCQHALCGETMPWFGLPTGYTDPLFIVNNSPLFISAHQLIPHQQ